MYSLKYIAIQLFKIFFLIISVSLISFILVSLSPIDPIQANFGQALKGTISLEQLKKIENYWGVNTPLSQRYLNWFSNFIKGDMGISLLYRKPVLEILKERLTSSLILMIIAWGFSGILGFFLGIISGIKKNSFIDFIIHKYALISNSIPSFWLALILLNIFSIWYHIFPVGMSIPIGLEVSDITFKDRILHGALPVITLTLVNCSGIILHTREKFIEVLDSDYILFARARGESLYRIIFHHSLRNILLPATSLQFASISEILGSSILIETIFSYPGLGQATVQAGLGGDIPLLLAITLITSIIIFMSNLIANILYGIIDPRISITKRKE